MITTWGIFWIGFFSVCVLNIIISRFFPTKISEKDFIKIKELVEILGKSITVNVTSEKAEVKKTKKPKD